MPITREWAEKQYDKMSAETQADVMAVLQTLEEKGTKAATTQLLKLEKKREWPRWVMYAIRDTVMGLSHLGLEKK